ncbi:unnamed protein product [Kuraishia capsulata CBS 1993]|uniref:Manganese/iron superoxide dismutase C-terminal domain-containing protein n=1 Tax=Kuraishia capsulata CBS 1993 TaxID=1382522 RepID=W6MJF3_9ASCO|nr:uncharacterized protein KUCA_T00002637001 [Kuraishia capsulata CBS 1993]CDK26664.1 unnamed protein product [Kuraishia capsulata CBS 1993]
MSRIPLRNFSSSTRRCVEAAKSLIQAPRIRHIDALKENGVLGLYSPSGLDAVWYSKVESKVKDLEYGISISTQRSTLERCFVEETAPATSNVQFEFSGRQTSISKFHAVLSETAKRADDSLVYQAAGSVYGAYYFVSSLVPNMRASATSVGKPDQSVLFETPSLATQIDTMIPERLKHAIEDSFGSLVEFRTLLLQSAAAINGDGYSWLVSSVPDRSNGHGRSFDPLFIVNTYNSGVPDNVVRGGQVATLRKFTESRLEDGVDNGFAAAPAFPTPAEAQELLTSKNLAFKPLLSINASPSAFLPDYGVYGKGKYLDNVWDCIDWSVVESRLPVDFVSRERIQKK